ncbi:MAG: prolipoprotein diacylglyceryl transferase [Campylobacterota bacterium]|nr:prolipoprotein diacylglyceryl transferase [Campylobacterota bacterium]
MEHFIWNIDPNIFEFGSIQLRWYGLLFVGSFFLGLKILDWVYKREGKDPAILETLLIYVMVGTVVGARLVHCLFYEPNYYLSNPLEILAIWKGGLASHGGLSGILIALYIFAKRYNESYMWLLARVAIPGALTAAFVRFGNLFNSEILGKPTEVPWAIIFERIDMIPRHPVQLYEAFAYLAICLLLLTIYRKVPPAFATKVLPGTFFLTLFTARFFIEYTKTRQAAYITDLPLSTGQMLSIPFILLGIIWIFWAFKTKEVK